ncbi:MAG: glycosyl hydrolase-related protein, partial [Thermomicrobiales bacterium]|nr:glycosyl hydrolase-related protein [Thermomicrobiales bacterium]
PIEDWTFTSADGEVTQLKRGDAWPVVDPHRPITLTATATIPEEWKGQPVEIQLWLGGEGLVTFTPGYQVGLNPFHHDWIVTESAAGGEQIQIEAEVMPKGMFGTHVHGPSIGRALVAIPHKEVRALHLDLEEIIRTAEELKDHEILPHLLDLVDDAYRAIAPYWPTSTNEVLTRGVKGDLTGGQTHDVGLGDYSKPGYRGELVMGGIWHIPPADSEISPLPKQALHACDTARGIIAERLEELRQQYPSVGKVMLTGHAHIDLAWLWPVAETRRKARRTFSTQLWLMDQYEDFVFNQSSAQAYKWIEQDDPALFARIQEAIKKGQWEVVGGSWLEPDSQVTGGEAYVRQLFYGQRYFQKKFGLRNSTAWLPDVFGFSAGVPQILLGAGIQNFFTIKVTWSEVNTFPYDLFLWEGLDGSRVLTHTFNNPVNGYNGEIEPEATHKTWQNFSGKRLHDQTLLSVGWGDGGGGPSVDMLEKYARIKDYPVLPQTRFGKVEDFFASLPTEGLPVFVGELYLELHRATLTTQALVKKLNRQGELRLVEAESFAALANRDGASYPNADIDSSWEDLLYNQFHDILPGSSINEVYQDTHPQLQAVVDNATAIRDNAIAERVGKGSGAWAITNPTFFELPLTALLPADASIGGRHGQTAEDGVLLYNASETIGAFETRIISASSEISDSGSTIDAVSATEAGDAIVIENALIRAEIGADGTLHSVFDKRVNRETLKDRGNQLWAYSDKPRAWDAWDIDETYETIGEEIGGIDSIEIVENGPLRVAVKVSRTFRTSTFVQTYRLLAESSRIDIATEIDWHERLTLVRTQFPTTIHTHEATYETMYGVHKRATNRNNAWERARFEVGAHKFADLSEPNYGVALLNNAKYGHNAVNGVLGMSLVRGPLHPDPFADEGHHEFTYSYFPHTGDWIQGKVTQEALALNAPMVVTEVAADASPIAPFVTIDGVQLGLGTVKKAHDRDGITVRVYEPHGIRGVSSMTFDRPVKAFNRTNMLEEDADGNELTLDGATASFEVRPFEIATFVVEFE